MVKEYKAKAKEVYPDLTNQFADFIAFDNSFIEETLKQGLLLFGGYHGALRFSDKGVQMAFTALSINALSQEAPRVVDEEEFKRLLGGRRVYKQSG